MGDVRSLLQQHCKRTWDDACQAKLPQAPWTLLVGIRLVTRAHSQDAAHDGKTNDVTMTTSWPPVTIYLTSCPSPSRPDFPVLTSQTP